MTRELATCFGFAVRSTLPFSFLREGEGDRLDVFLSEADSGRPGELMREWTWPGIPGYRIELYEDGDLYRLYVTGLGWFVIDPYAPNVGVPANAANPVTREAALWGTPASLCFQARGDLPIHAAAVEVDGHAVLFAAPGSSGKTTMTAGFWRAGHRLLSEDLTCLRPHPAPAVIPGPAIIRLRRDVAERLELPLAEVARETPDRVTFSLADERRGDCRPVPVAAVVILRPSEDRFRLERAESASALPDLWALSSLLLTEDYFERRFTALADLARAVPIWNISYPHRLEVLDDTVERIVASL